MKPAQRCRVVSFSCRYRESTTALQHDVPLFGDRVDIIGYLIDGIYIRHENSQISIIPEREGRGERKRGAFSSSWSSLSKVPFQREMNQIFHDEDEEGTAG